MIRLDRHSVAHVILRNKNEFTGFKGHYNRFQQSCDEFFATVVKLLRHLRHFALKGLLVKKIILRYRNIIHLNQKLVIQNLSVKTNDNITK